MKISGELFTNLENVAKHLPNDREFIVCDEKHKYLTDYRVILD